MARLRARLRVRVRVSVRVRLRVRARVRIRVRVRVRVRGLGLGLGAYAWRSLGRRHGPAASTAEASDAAPLCATVGESVPLLPLTHLFGHFIVYAGL